MHLVISVRVLLKIYSHVRSTSGLRGWQEALEYFTPYQKQCGGTFYRLGGARGTSWT